MPLRWQLRRLGGMSMSKGISRPSKPSSLPRTLNDSFLGPSRGREGTVGAQKPDNKHTQDSGPSTQLSPPRCQSQRVPKKRLSLSERGSRWKSGFIPRSTLEVCRIRARISDGMSSISRLRELLRSRLQDKTNIVVAKGISFATRIESWSMRAVVLDAVW